MDYGGNVRGDNALHLLAYDNVDRATNDNNRPANERRFWQGVYDLVRTQSDSAYFPARTSTVNGWYNTHTFTWDVYGNLTQDQGANLRCRTITYDSLYAQLPVTETLYKTGCGSASLVTTVNSYDRGLEVPLQVTDVAGQPTKVDYDGFGRVVALTKPNPSSPGSLSPLPSTTIEYLLPTPGGPAYSRIHASTQDGADPSSSQYLETWNYVDGLGRTVATLKEAETGQWIVSGLSDSDNKGALRNKYLEFFTGSGSSFNPSAPAPTPPASQSYDAFARPLVATDYDGTITLSNRYHALATDHYDAEDIAGQGLPAHDNTYVTDIKDGLGRILQINERFATNESLLTRMQYTPLDQPEIIRRIRISNGTQVDETNRYLLYDTQRHLTAMGTPDAGPGYVTLAWNATPNRPNIPPGSKWFYRYNDMGDMVGISDPRGCGANFFYDGLGRLTKEDYFPCTASQTPYSVPSPSTGVPTSGVEVLYEYDALSGSATPSSWTAGTSNGRLVRVQDQSTHSLFKYDARGNIVETALRVGKPGASPDTVLANRYTSRWYRQTQTYDAADRPVTQSTGAATTVGGESGGTDSSVLALLGSGSQSTVTTNYGSRGAVSSVSSSYDYGASGGGNWLVKGDGDDIIRTADGLISSIHYGDAASTHSGYLYDERRRLQVSSTIRDPLGSWPQSGLATFQQLLEDTEFTYDAVSNPLTITDERKDTEWPSGSKPATRAVSYDDFYRVTGITYAYQGVAGNADPWTSPFANENAAIASAPSDPQSAIDSRRAIPSPHVSFTNRPTSQGYAYDYLGNTTSTTDDQNGFYDRSLGTVTNGTAASGPHQLKRATITTGGNTGTLTAQYDSAGNMVSMYLDRNGTCLPSGKCAQVYKYEYDELNRLQRARRWDMSDVNPDANPLPTVNDGQEIVDLRYRYDADDNRVIKWAHDTNASHAVTDAYTLYVFDSLDVRRAQFNTTASSNEYELTSQTEVPYLFANGVRLGRVVYEENIPASSPTNQHVFFELGDHLGSTNTVLDKATGELVEKATYQAYGGAESDYRPGRWADFREDYGFTGKEEDVEVGLVYFGKRYLNPLLGRWVTPDPLGLHDGQSGKADLNLYAYVRGMALKAVDPRGLAETSTDQSVQGNAEPRMSIQAGTTPPQNACSAEDPEELQSVAPPKTLTDQETATGRFLNRKDAIESPIVQPTDVGAGFVRPGVKLLGSAAIKSFTAKAVTKAAVPGMADVEAAMHAEGAFSPIVPGGLTAHEGTALGHTLGRHVGKTAAELDARIADEGVRLASSFASREQAEAAGSAAFSTHEARIAEWVTSGAPARLTLDTPFSGGLVRVPGGYTATQTSARFVLQGNGSGGYFILTGFPTP